MGGWVIRHNAMIRPAIRLWMLDGRRWHRPIRNGLIVATLVYAGLIAIGNPDAGGDAYSYWLAHGYSGQLNSENAFLYSPVFLQLLAPFQSLPWPVFHLGWTLLEAAALVWMLGPLAVIAIVFPPVTQELLTLNIHLLLAAAVVAGFRWPAAWAFVLLTKVAPGIGLLWFVLRGEWRSLAIALGVTVAIAGISFVVAPSLWFAWLGILTGGLSVEMAGYIVPVPFLVRLPIAIALVAISARSDRPWLVPIACMLALPVMWIGGLAILVAAVSPRISDWASRPTRDALIGLAEPIALP